GRQPSWVKLQAQTTAMRTGTALRKRHHRRNLDSHRLLFRCWNARSGRAVHLEECAVRSVQALHLRLVVRTPRERDRADCVVAGDQALECYRTARSAFPVSLSLHAIQEL